MHVVSTNARKNNFNIIRFVAAFMVISGHMGYITGRAIPMLWGQGIQTLGVKIFFLMGGYLISKSWCADPHPCRYMLKRIFRIFPALVVFVCIVTFIMGPLLSNLSLNEYFSNPITWRYLRNIGLHVEYSLPGVFTQNPYPNVVNGSLWTLPIEFSMYCMVPILLTLFKKGKNEKVSFALIAGLVISVCIFQILHLYKYPQWRHVIYATDIAQAFDLIPYYLLGILYTYPHVQKYLNIQVASILLLFCSCFNLGVVGSNIIMYTIFPYIIFSIALTPNAFFANIFAKCEVSYGLYLYGFFIQQVVVQIYTKIWGAPDFTNCLVISFILTFIFAVFSYKFVEAPLQKVCAKYTKKK